MTDIKYHVTVKDDYGTYDSVEQWQKSFRGDYPMNYPKDAAQGLNDQAMARGMYGTAVHTSLGQVNGHQTNLESKTTPLLIDIENRLEASNEMLGGILHRLIANLDRALGSEPKDGGTLNAANVCATHASQIGESLDNMQRLINGISYELTRLERVI